eukprot:18766-Eustigmatos_ZCMA.PRE.1
MSAAKRHDARRSYVGMCVRSASRRRRPSVYGWAVTGPVILDSSGLALAQTGRRGHPCVTHAS